MATAKRLPSGSWRVRIYAGKDASGKAIYESFTAATKREAERQAAVWNVDRKGREHLSSVDHMTVEVMLDKYIATCKSRRLSPSTIATYVKFKNNSFPSLLHKQIASVTPLDIQAALDARAQTHSGKTVKNEFSFLVTVFGVYRESLNLSKLVYPPLDQEEMQIPEDEGVQRLLSQSRSNPDFYIAVLLAAVMGLRRSEICALEWSDMDCENQTLTIDKALVKDENKNFVLKQPKTRAGKRTLFIPDAVFQELLHLRSLNKRMVNLTPDAVTRRYERARDAAGISCRFHDLRHYHASVMLALNVPIKYIIADMGHATPNMVNNVYGHRMKEKEKVINSQMDKYATSLLSGEAIDYHMPQNMTRLKRKSIK